MKNEKDVKKNVRKVLDEYAQDGIWYYMPAANGYGRSGIPDFVGLYKGNFFAIETKFGTNDLSTHQIREVASIIQGGGKCWIVRDSNIHDWEFEFAAWAALC